jgi:hypothetical protein
MMQLLLSWGYWLAAIASAVAALRTHQYILLLGVPIALAALPIVSLAPIARNLLNTASNDAAIPAAFRLLASLLVRYSFVVIILLPITFAVLLFGDHFVGAWLVGAYTFASNTIRLYRAKYLPPYATSSKTNVAPGETAIILKAIFGGRTVN